MDKFLAIAADWWLTWAEGATAEEIAAWEAERPAPQMIPSQSEKLRADVDFLSAVTGVQL